MLGSFATPSQFVDKLLSESGIDPHNSALKQAMAQELEARLKQYYVTALLNQLPEQKFAEFERVMTDEPTADHVVSFLEQAVVGSKEIWSEVQLNFKRQFLTQSVAV